MKMMVRHLSVWMLLLVMWSASLRAGLFFDQDVYAVSTFWGGACLLLLSGYIALGDKHYSLQHKNPLVPLLILAGFMLFIYTWHWMNGPLSMKGTGDEIIRWGLFGSVGLMAWIVSRGTEGGKLLRLVWHTTGMMLCGGALLAIYGMIDVPYMVFHTADPAISATGTRLGGLMQYPNVFGAVMAAFLLERLFALPAALHGRAGSFGAAAALLPLAPYTAALLLTESRGAWIAAALACAAGLAADRRFAAPIFAAAAAPTLGAALLYRQLADVQLAPAVLPGLLWLAGLWAGGVLAGLLLCRAALHRPGAGVSPAVMSSAIGLVQSAQSQNSSPIVRSITSTQAQSINPGPAKDPSCRWSITAFRQPLSLVAAALCYIIAILSILIRVRSRLAGEDETMSARHLMYKDAWELFRSAPWFGQGGDSWRLSYRAIQSQPYVGAEVHSGYIDLLLNTGCIGLLIVLTLLLISVFRLKRNSPRLLPSFLVLILHSVIDFDWSFGLVWLLIFWLAVMGGEGKGKEIDLKPVPLAPAIQNFKMHRVILISIVGLLVWTVLAFSYWMGNHEYEQALHTVNREEREELLKSAVRWNPSSTEAVLLLADLLPTDEAAILLMNSLYRSPGHPELTWTMAELQAMSGNAVQAATWYRISLNSDKFNATKHTHSVSALADIVRKQWASGRNRVAVRTAYAALGLYELYRSKVEFLAMNPSVRNDRNFRITHEAAQEGRNLERWIKETKLIPLVIRQKHP